MDKDKKVENDKSLLIRFPDLAKEWHPTKNKNLTLDKVSPYSKKMVWWKTDEGKEFQSPVRYRTTNYIKKDSNVKPVELSGKHKSKEERQELLKENSLAVKYPDIADEWDYEKNEGVRPEEVLEKSGKSFWFKCSKGHSWKARVINRTSKHSKCPICVMEEKRLINTRPDIAAEFSYDKNKDVNILELTASSNQKIWWNCNNCGEAYQETVIRRSKGIGCPKCAPKKKKQVPYEKSLEFKYPEIAAEWHPTKNGKLTPGDVRPMSGLAVWWKCSADAGHEAWKAIIHNRTYKGTIQNRTYEGTGCPTCNLENKKAIKGNKI